MAEHTPTILIVDDLVPNRHLLATILELEGFTIHTASSGDQAVVMAPQVMPDLILMDVNMPGMSGIEACKQLKADGRTSDIPVIFISSANLTEDKLHGFEAGGVDYITRPFKVPEVLARVKAQLTIRHLQQQLQSANQTLEVRLAELALSQAALQESEMRYRLLVDYSPLAILVYQEGKIVFANPAALALLGYNLPQDLMGKPMQDLVHPDFRGQAEEQIMPMGEHETPVPTRVEKYIRQDGALIDVEIMTIPYIYQRQKMVQVVIRDITERKRNEEIARYLSTHDVLTNLYNRNYYETEIVRLQDSRSYPISVVVADVDDLKMTNDTNGHSAGDILLQRVAQVMQQAFRAEDMVARIGGDEFAVILPHTDEAAAAAIFERLKAFLEDLNRNHAELPLYLSLGIATGYEPLTLPEIAKRADDAMYLDKSQNKRNRQQFDH
jgi:two-component system, cell cycle response regulator